MHVITFIKDKARPLALSFGFYRLLLGQHRIRRHYRVIYENDTLVSVNIPFNIQPFLESVRE